MTASAAKATGSSNGKRWRCHLCGKTGTAPDGRAAFEDHYFTYHWTPAPF